MIGIMIGIMSLFGFSNTKASKEELPYAPLRVDFRRSALEVDGRVLQVQNISDKGLSCTLGHPGGNYRFFLKPYDSAEFGSLEIGRSFSRGDTYTINVEGYHESMVLPVP
jgi:hypothetical protein